MSYPDSYPYDPTHSYYPENMIDATNLSYFPENMIHATIATVEPSGLAFMGEFEVSGSLRLEDADDTQTHYFNLFRPWHARSNAVLRFSRRMALADWFVAEYRKDQSEMATQRFLESSHRSLAELG